jgi:hypothetical protein
VAIPPLSVEEAQIFSAAAAQDGTLEQRRRWEGGYLTSAVRWVPRTLFESIGRGDLGGVWATLDLLIPPIALLVLLDLGALIAAVLGLCLSGASAWPLLLLAGALLFATIALATAWASGGSRFVPLSSIARIPGYLIWKLPLYLGFARHGVPKEWLRTPRE